MAARTAPVAKKRLLVVDDSITTRTLEKSILSALSYEERAHLLDLLAKILTRAAEVATDQPEPIAGQRIRHARLGGVPQHS